MKQQHQMRRRRPPVAEGGEYGGNRLRAHRDVRMSVNRRQSGLGGVQRRRWSRGGRAWSTFTVLICVEHGSDEAATAIAGERVPRPNAVSTSAVDERDRPRCRRRLRQPGPQRGHSRYVAPSLSTKMNERAFSLSRARSRP